MSRDVRKPDFCICENKDADQLRGYREADLRLCFRICKNPVFSRRGSFEPRRQKTGLRGFRPGPTQTGLRNY